MKNFLLFTLFILLILITKVYSQSGWINNPQPPQYSFSSVYFINENTGWICGSSENPVTHIIESYIYKTTDSGNSWNIQSSDTGRVYKTIYFVNTNTGWYAGYDGIIKKTTNGGNNWVHQTPSINPEVHFRAINMWDENTGWIVGQDIFGGDGFILKTTNGGSNWIIDYYKIGSYLSSVYCISSNHCWAVGQNGTILSTTNGGETWEQQNSGTNNTLHSVYFVNLDIGWAVGNNGTILKTTNGGANWFSQNKSRNNSNLNSINFINSNTGWTVGSEGIIKKTTNGGANWLSQISGISDTLHCVFFVNASIGWAVGDSGAILKTTTGGVWVRSISNEIPSKYFLHQNYPNPFNPTTTIRFDIPKAAYVKLNVFNILGKKITTLINEKLSAGSYEVDWPAPMGDASGYPSGVYFYKLITDEFVCVKKMISIK